MTYSNLIFLAQKNITQSLESLLKLVFFYRYFHKWINMSLNCEHLNNVYTTGHSDNCLMFKFWSRWIMVQRPSASSFLEKESIIWPPVEHTYTTTAKEDDEKSLQPARGTDDPRKTDEQYHAKYVLDAWEVHT